MDYDTNRNTILPHINETVRENKNLSKISKTENQTKTSYPTKLPLKSFKWK